LDTNSDGALTKEELHARPGHPKAAKAGPSKHLRMFEKIDADGDGNVTKVEAEAAANEHFSRLDKNSDGTITKDEIRKGPRSKHMKAGHGHKGSETGSPRGK